MGLFKRRPGKQWIDGKNLRLADEVRYIQRRAAKEDSRIVTVGPLLLFSTQSGDAWLLDPADQLASCLAREGEALPVSIEETETQFAVEWQGKYRIDEDVFVYRDKASGNVRSIIGYPTRRISDQISNMFG